MTVGGRCAPPSTLRGKASDPLSFGKHLLTETGIGLTPKGIDDL
jgi:hypothetical protein